MTPTKRLEKIASLLRGMRSTPNKPYEGRGYLGIDYTVISLPRLRKIHQIVKPYKKGKSNVR